MVDLYCKQHARPNSLGPTPQRRPCVPMSCVPMCHESRNAHGSGETPKRPVLPLPHDSDHRWRDLRRPSRRHSCSSSARAARCACLPRCSTSRGRVRQASRAPRSSPPRSQSCRRSLPAASSTASRNATRSPPRPHMHTCRTAQTSHLSPHWHHRHHRSQLAPLTPLTPHPAVATRWRRAPVPTARRPATPTAPRWATTTRTTW